MESWVILSLDDSNEWHYLWPVLSVLKIGSVFKKLVKFVIYWPKGESKNLWKGASCFLLSRTQGRGAHCWPCFFSVVVEPLTIAIRTAGSVRGFRRGVDEEKISLYADDILLFLGDANYSLITAITIIKRFVGFSGISINWDESCLRVLDICR